MLKRPEPPDGFQGRVFKGNIIRFEGCRVHDQLVDILRIGCGEVTGLLEVNIINLLVPTSLGSTCLWAACSYFLTLGRVLVSSKTIQGMAQDIIYNP